MMAGIVTAGAAFGLTVSEAKTETMCLQTKYGGNLFFNVTSADQVHKQTINFVCLCVAISAHRDLGVEVMRRIQGTWASSGRYDMEVQDCPGVY